MQSVRDVCTPHESVFSKSKAETVANIADLRIAGKIDADRFFAETYVTTGMQSLLGQVFDRLLEDGPQGVFRLKQAMGGGKTHNLLTAGLLAQNSTIRKKFFSEMGKAVSGAPIRLAVFDGRETDRNAFLWSDLAAQLDRQQKLTTPNEVPGPTTWTEVVGPQPCLIVLDELPPYLENLATKKIGIDQTEADRFAHGLTNLMIAVASNQLPNCCLILTDLVSSWQKGSDKLGVVIEEATKRISNEASRVCLDVMPVRLDGSELYGILRKRLFSRFPGKEEIRPVAQAYSAAYEKAAQQKAIPESYKRWASKIEETYPFHPGLDDLIARFRENSGFQQTREVLRLAQKMVAQVWEQKQDVVLIHPHQLDFNDSDVENLLSNINSGLDNARSRDIVQHGYAAAESLAQSQGNLAPLEAAKLVYLSSLSTAVNALQGLLPDEVAAYLCAPDRDVAQISSALLTALEDDSWYLHRRTDGRWCYREVKNVNSVIKEAASSLPEDIRRKEVKKHLEKQFKPGQAAGGAKPVYQRLLVFPAIDDIKLDPNEVSLVISEPREDGLHPDLRSFWKQEVWQNRVLFLTGTDGFASVKETASYVKAAEDLLLDLRSSGNDKGSSESRQTEAALDRWTACLNSALRECFTRLYYPLEDQLESKSLKFSFAANKYVGEETILESLKEEQKFRTDCKSDPSFRKEFEELIFAQQTMSWKDMVSTMARRSDWYWSAPGSLESLKQECILKGIWRGAGTDYLQKGPFPKEKTSVDICPISCDDKTGKATLNVDACFADRVHYSIGKVLPTSSSPSVEGGRLETTELVLNFLAIDSTGQHETGLFKIWKNTIHLRQRITCNNGVNVLELECAPAATIKYTLDGSDPKYGQTYESPVPLPLDAVLILAIAERDEIWSDRVEARVPKTGAAPPIEIELDVKRPVIWKTRLDRTGRKNSFDLLSSLENAGAKLHGFRWAFNAEQDSDRWLHLQAGERMKFHPSELEALIGEAQAKLPTADDPAILDASLKLSRLEFETGAHLLQFAQALGIEIKPSEVVQK